MAVGYSTTIVAITCGCCGIPFGLPSNLDIAAREDGRLFYCPNGHHICYTESKNDELRREKERLEARLVQRNDQLEVERERLLHERRSHAGTKGYLTRLKRRIANGVCPCCRRSFSNVRRHMDSQHPEFIEEMRAKEKAVS